MADKSQLLFPLSLTGPGAAGLTEEHSMAGDVPSWLFEANNAIFTKDGLLAPRELWRGYPSSGTLPPLGGNIFYPTHAGTRYFVSIDKKIYTQFGQDLFSSSFLVDDGMEAPTVPTITKHWKAVYLAKGGSTPEYGTYFFANGEKPKYYSGNFYFSQIPTGPRSDIAHAAFGRIWCVYQDRLFWSAYLNGKVWTGAGTGSLDLSMNLGQGEKPTAIADFNNFLVVFTNRAIMIFDNPFNVPVDVTGTLGTTGTLKLKEKIDGAGCVGPNAWCAIGEDLMFVAYSGLYRLGRIVSEGGSNPFSVVCPQINGSVTESMAGFAGSSDTNPNIRLNYHPLFSFVSLETATVQHGVFILWLNRPIDNKSYAVTRWGAVPEDRMQLDDTYAEMYQKNTSIYGMFSITSPTGAGRAILAIIICRDEVGQPSYFAGFACYGAAGGYEELTPVVETEGFEFRIKSAWLTFGNNPAEPAVKIPKD